MENVPLRLELVKKLVEKERGGEKMERRKMVRNFGSRMSNNSIFESYFVIAFPFISRVLYIRCLIAAV